MGRWMVGGRWVVVCDSYISVCGCAVMTTFGGLTRVSDCQLMRDPLAVSEHTHDHTVFISIHTIVYHSLLSKHNVPFSLPPQVS